MHQYFPKFAVQNIDNWTRDSESSETSGNKLFKDKLKKKSFDILYHLWLLNKHICRRILLRIFLFFCSTWKSKKPIFANIKKYTPRNTWWITLRSAGKNFNFTIRPVDLVFQKNALMSSEYRKPTCFSKTLKYSKFRQFRSDGSEILKF